MNEFTILALPLLWVGSDVFRQVPMSSLGVDVGTVVPRFWEVTVLMGGIGL